MIPFRRRLNERFSNVLEWIDGRRDANVWPLFALPPLLSVAWAYGGWIGLGIVLAFAAAVTLLVSLVSSLALALWIVWKALLDVVTPLLATKGRPTYSGRNRSATSR